MDSFILKSKALNRLMLDKVNKANEGNMEWLQSTFNSYKQSKEIEIEAEHVIHSILPRTVKREYGERCHERLEVIPFPLPLVVVNDEDDEGDRMKSMNNNKRSLEEISKSEHDQKKGTNADANHLEDFNKLAEENDSSKKKRKSSMMNQDNENHVCLLTQKEYLQNLFVAELQAILRKNGIPEKGLKSDLINRIMHFYSSTSSKSDLIQSENKEIINNHSSNSTNHNSKDIQSDLNQLSNSDGSIDKHSSYQRSDNYSKDYPNRSSTLIAKEPSPSALPVRYPSDSYSLFPHRDDENPSLSDSNHELIEELNPKEKMIPNWATDTELEKALRYQYSNPHRFDPDKIFSQATAPDLNTIFDSNQDIQKKKSRNIRPRGSSAKWSTDNLTLEEIEVWRRDNGYEMNS